MWILGTHNYYPTGKLCLGLLECQWAFISSAHHSVVKWKWKVENMFSFSRDHFSSFFSLFYQTSHCCGGLEGLLLKHPAVLREEKQAGAADGSSVNGISYKHQRTTINAVKSMCYSLFLLKFSWSFHLLPFILHEYQVTHSTIQTHTHKKK